MQHFLTLLLLAECDDKTRMDVHVRHVMLSRQTPIKEI